MRQSAHRISLLLVFAATIKAWAVDVAPQKQWLNSIEIGAPRVMELRPAVQVDGNGVFLNHLLLSSTDQQPLRLCDSPAFGTSLTLKRHDIAQLARATGYQEMVTNWVGPDAIRITRRARPLAEKEALQLLTSALQEQFVKDLGELELRLSRSWTTIQVPDEPFSIKVTDLPATGVCPTFIARFEIVTGTGERFGSWQASLQAKVWRELWTVRTTVKRGEPVRASDLTRERRDMLVCREPAAELPPEEGVLEFCEGLSAGTPVWARAVRLRAIVHRGQTLAAVIQDGALMINLKVEALEDGAAGQLIRVRNPLSRRDLHGRVVDEVSVLVAL